MRTFTYLWYNIHLPNIVKSSDNKNNQILQFATMIIMCCKFDAKIYVQVFRQQFAEATNWELFICSKNNLTVRYL